MERLIGLLIVGGTLAVLVSMHRDARDQGWRWPVRAVLYASVGAILVLALLLMLGSTEAAQIMFVGFGVVLAGVVLLMVGLALVAGIIAWRDRQHDETRARHAEPPKESETD